jgi:phosphoribosylanthranilate isomerase
LKDLSLYGLDLNSGVEIEPGMKDVDKIKELKRIIA